MFIYLSKKIAIPNNTRLKCIAWNREQGFIACGGDDGLLKVLKLEAAKEGKVRGLAAPSNLSTNQTLEGHSGQIQVVTWNEVHQKLTSSDQYGLIVVWMAYKGSWYEEMINNRNKSVVRGMAWNSEGLKICIVYEDGAVIVGSVDGNRIWGKELKGCQLTGVAWSPDSRILLFSMQNGEVHAYDGAGGFVSKLNIQCQVSSSGIPQVAGMSWYDGKHGFYEPDCPVLAICYDNGRLQLMKHENDDVPVLLDTGLTTVWCGWNHNGGVLAVAGQLPEEDPPGSPPRLKSASESNSQGNVVQFYSPFGEHLRTLKVPGRRLSCCAWEGGSLRIALAVDSFIYFANVRPDYKWCSFSSGTLAFAFTRPDQAHPCVVFWDTDSGQTHAKQVRHLMAMAAAGEHCVLATRLDDGTGQFGLVVCNAIGTPVDSRFVDMEPLWIAATSRHVFAANHESFLVWGFRTPKERTATDAAKSTPSGGAGGAGGGKRKERDLRIHIDDVPSGITSSLSELGDRMLQSSPQHKPTTDPICALAAGEKALVVGRESGLLHHYSLPQLALVKRHTLPCRPHMLEVNCNSTRVAVVDVTGVLTVVDLSSSVMRKGSQIEDITESGGGGGGSKGMSSLERKDVWAMRWADDNPDMLAVMEKTRMYVFRGGEPEEPVLSSGYVCIFRDLEIRAVLLDELLVSPHPDEPAQQDCLLRLEVKALRDARDLLEKVGLTDMAAFVEENPHPRLWRLVAEAALEKLELKLAESALVRCKDYVGIQLVKRLQTIPSEAMKKAEIATYLSQFDEAERLYLESDRRDLALDLRRKLGDWFRVTQLLQQTPVTASVSQSSVSRTSPSEAGDASRNSLTTPVEQPDPQMEEAWASLGDHFADRHNWDSAKEYYEKSKCMDRLAQCYYVLEDYEGLERVLRSLPENHTLLPWLANTFASVGLCDQAVQAFLKCGQPKQAVDTCVTLNQWSRAVGLAQEHHLPEIGGLLDKYAHHLLDKGKSVQAIELYRKAGHYEEAARLLYGIAEEETRRKSPPVLIKKLYVLAALLIEDNRKRHGVTKPHAHLPTLNVLSPEERAEAPEARRPDNSWHGAEAFHFFMLAQRQLYDGMVDAATKTAIQLRRYDDVLDPEDSYRLMALASCANRAYGTCSKAFVRLEALEGPRKHQYEELAVDIFGAHVAKDTRQGKMECVRCETMVPDCLFSCPECGVSFQPCIVTGRSLSNPTHAWNCNVCRHTAGKQDMAGRQTCPLCHSPVMQSSK